MTKADAQLLGAAVALGALTTLTVHNSLLDDSKTRTLIQHLLPNKHLKSLSLAHNTIADRGARAIAKLIAENSVIDSIDVKDNQVGAEGDF